MSLALDNLEVEEEPCEWCEDPRSQHTPPVWKAHQVLAYDVEVSRAAAWLKAKGATP